MKKKSEIHIYMNLSSENKRDGVKFIYLFILLEV